MIIEVLFDPIRICCRTSLGLNISIYREYLKKMGGNRDRKASLHRIFGA
jgi:hypothetical protein